MILMLSPLGLSQVRREIPGGKDPGNKHVLFAFVLLE